MITTTKSGLTDKFRPPATKVCRLCKEDKPTKDFARNFRGRSGYANECRVCKNDHENRKKEEQKEQAKTFFDAKFFTLFLLLSTSLTAFSQVSYNAICHHNTPACRCGSGEVVVKDTVNRRTPDTLRAIILVTMCPNCLAHARMGFVVICEGKRPVYLDCRKRALKGRQMGWGWVEVNPNEKVR